MKTVTGKILTPQMIDLAIKSEFAQYASDIEACFTGSDRDALHKICLALEHYALDVGLGDHRVKSGITGLKCLIVKRALCRGSVSHDLLKRYGVEARQKDLVAVTFRDIEVTGTARTCEYSDAPIRIKP